MEPVRSSSPLGRKGDRRRGTKGLFFPPFPVSGSRTAAAFLLDPAGRPVLRIYHFPIFVTEGTCFQPLEDASTPGETGSIRLVQFVIHSLSALFSSFPFPPFVRKILTKKNLASTLFDESKENSRNSGADGGCTVEDVQSPEERVA